MMKCAATRKMVNALNGFFDKNNIPYEADYVTLSPDVYDIYVSESYENMVDYNRQTGEMRAIKIYYPDEYFAAPKYLTTIQLLKLFKHCDGTLTNFLKCVFGEIEI